MQRALPGFADGVRPANSNARPGLICGLGGLIMLDTMITYCGAAAFTFMMVMYALEGRHRASILAFAVGASCHPVTASCRERGRSASWN